MTSVEICRPDFPTPPRGSLKFYVLYSSIPESRPSNKGVTATESAALPASGGKLQELRVNLLRLETASQTRARISAERISAACPRCFCKATQTRWESLIVPRLESLVNNR